MLPLCVCMCHIVLLCVESGNVGVKLIDLGNCFSPTGTDTSRISFEMQTLPFRAPEVQSTVSAQQHLMLCCFMRPRACCMSPRAPHISLLALAHCISCNLETLLSAPTPAVPCHYSNTTAGKHSANSESKHQLQHQQAKNCLLA